MDYLLSPDSAGSELSVFTLYHPLRILLDAHRSTSVIMIKKITPKTIRLCLKFPFC